MIPKSRFPGKVLFHGSMGIGAGKDTDWKEIAWNGIRFEVPPAWELSKIGQRYLILEEETGPVLEVKWGSIKGTFSHGKHLRKLHALYGKRSGISIEESPLPGGWQEALDNYDVSGFSWSGKAMRGSGVVLFCPRCRNATLIQFYHKEVDIPIRISRRILASFTDHRPDGQVIWSVFDIRAATPDTFRLIRYRFEPGVFELALVFSGQNVILYRWGPAEILLTGRTLREFAAAMVRLPEEMTSENAMEESDIVEWKTAPICTGWSRLWYRFRGKAEFQWFRIWHERGKNRILGVKYEGKRPTATDFLEHIADGYETR